MNHSAQQKVVASIVTGNYIPQAMTTFEYLQKSNPYLPYLVLIIGERGELESRLPNGPTWMFWDELTSEEERNNLAAQYLAFELSCVIRGRLHRYLATQSKYSKWIVVDTDIGILASLEPLYEKLDHAPICLTAHSKQPINKENIVPQESNLLELGLYNGGVVAMRRSEEATSASQWLCERLEKYGRSRRHRQGLSLPSEDFEFVDQIWLNLIPAYFPGTTILYDEIYNLGHWNLYQGTLITIGNSVLFNGKQVVIIHFSGLPDDRLEHVAAHASIYRENPNHAWAQLAQVYLDKLNHFKQILPASTYSYSKVQPGQPIQSAQQSTNTPTLVRTNLDDHAKANWRQRLPKPEYIVGLFELMTWWLKQAAMKSPIQIIRSIDDYLYCDHSENEFTGLVPCIGNYQTYLIRAWILESILQAKENFHGVLLGVGEGSAAYKNLIMANGKVTEYKQLNLENSTYHQDTHLILEWDGIKIPLDSQSVDTVMITETLERESKPSGLLQEIHRIIKPSGTLFLVTTSISSMGKSRHTIYSLSPITLKKHLEEAGFIIQEIQLLGGWHHSLALQIGIWLTNSPLAENKRKLLKLLAWPIYSYLVHKGHREYIDTSNYQGLIGLATLAKPVTRQRSPSAISDVNQVDGLRYSG